MRTLPATTIKIDKLGVWGGILARPCPLLKTIKTMDKQYFSHDLGSRNDPKLVMLRIDKGLEGLGIFWCLIEILYEQDNRLEFKNIKALAYELHVEESLVRSVICDYELFCYDETAFWSNSIERRVSKRNDITEKRRKAGRARTKRSGSEQNSESVEQNENFAQQDKQGVERAESKSESLLSTIYINKEKKDINKKEKETDTHTELRNGVSVSPSDCSVQSSAPDEALVQEFVDLYHKHCPDLPRVEHLTQRVRMGIAHILAIDHHDMAAVAKTLTQIGENKFLNGGGPNGWKASLPWLVEGDRWADIRNGKFEQGAGVPKANSMVYHAKKELKGF